MTLAPWQRPRFRPGGPPARVLLFGFAQDPLPDPLPLSRTRHGIPDGGPPDGLALHTVDREQEQAWFEDFFPPHMRPLTEEQLGDALAPTLAARVAHVIEAELDDPTDLGYLQSAWALARCLCENGVTAILDAHRTRFWPAADILAWPIDRPFQLDREVELILESDETPGIGRIAHTRGMAKFGRPDLIVLGVPDGLEEACAAVLYALADAMALGSRFSPGDIVEDEDGQEIRFAAYEPDDDTPDLHLDNGGLVLVP